MNSSVTDACAHRTARGLGTLFRWVPFFFLGILLDALPLAAQSGGGAPLPVDHWAHAALERLAAARLLGEDWVEGARPISVGEAVAALRTAARNDDGGALHGFAAEALERLLEEYPVADGAEWWRGSGASVGYASRTDGDDAWHGAVLAPRIILIPADAAAIVYEAGLEWGGGAGERPSGDLVHHRVLAGARLGPVRVVAGRQRWQFGTGTQSIVLGDAAPHDAVGVALAEPAHVRWLGPLRASLLLRRIGGDRYGQSATLAAMRVAFVPHPAVQVNLSRTMVVAGTVEGKRVGPGDVVLMFFGKHTDFEDQVAAVGAQLRARILGRPVEPYLEWGFTDTAGLDEDPAVVAGVFVPVMPGFPEASLRYEYTAFGESARPPFLPCCHEPRSWYRHYMIRDRYVDGEGRPLGHPLGGYGHEHRVEGAAWLAQGRARMTGALVVREREAKNILHDVRPGRSTAGELAVTFHLRKSLTLRSSIEYERGTAGWSTLESWFGLLFLP